MWLFWFRRCTDWSKHNVQKDNGLSLAGAKPLSEPTLVYIVNWTLANKLQWKFIYINIFAFTKMHLKMSSGKMASILFGPQWVNMNQVFMLVCSRSVTMPGLDQNWSLLPALGRFRRKVVMENYGVKKTTREHVLGRRWVDIGRAMSAQRRFDVGLMSPADVGPTSVRRQSQNLNIIIKTNKCSTTKRYDSFLSSKKSNNNNGSLHDACKSLKQM